MKPTMNELPTLIEPAAYRIRFVGRMRNGWSDFLAGLQESISESGGSPVTELIGIVHDQSALFGLLCHIRDLSLPLLSVEFIKYQKGE